VTAAKRDYYEVLGVARDADSVELKRAYRKLAMQYHPDRNPNNPAAEDYFKEATEAYTVLADADKRRRYDRMGHAAFGGPGQGFEAVDFASVTEILEGLFGEVFFGRQRRPKRRVGRDLKYELTIDFVEAALGAEKTVSVNRPRPCVDCAGSGAAPGTEPTPCAVCLGKGEVRLQRGFFAASRPCTACQGRGVKIEVPCPSCSGSGSVAETASLDVKIPAGVDSGAVRTVRGGGEIAPGGAGDLHVTITVAPHPLFTREGADILCTVPVSFPQAALGATLDIPTLEGRVSMKLPPGTQSGKVFRLRGKGIPTFGGAGKGDQLVSIVVEVPSRVTRKQRKLIVELAEEMGIDTHPQQAGFLDKLRSLFD
jgi:molecular chaperone DnaJ